MLYERGYKREKVLELLRCLDWLMALPTGLEQRFWHELATWETNMGKPYLATFERVAMEKGMQQGLQEGLQQGMQQGMQQGVQQGLQAGWVAALRAILEARFGQLPTELHRRIEVVESLETLDALLRTVATATSLEAFQNSLDR